MEEFTDRELDLIIASVLRSKSGMNGAALKFAAVNPTEPNPYADTIGTYQSAFNKLIVHRTVRSIKSVIVATNARCEHGNIPADCEECNPILAPEKENASGSGTVSYSLARRRTREGTED